VTDSHDAILNVQRLPGFKKDIGHPYGAASLKGPLRESPPAACKKRFNLEDPKESAGSTAGSATRSSRAAANGQAAALIHIGQSLARLR
jgi:hypothetical protein